MKTTKKKKIKIRYKRLFVFLFCVFFIILIANIILNIKIKNIYVIGNTYLNDQEIIEKSLLSDYPKSLFNPSFKVKDRLESEQLILEANVYKKGLSKIYIEITENKPLFYYEYESKTVYYDGTSNNEKYVVPTVINYITDTYYEKFVDEMKKLDSNVISRISEIKFYPNEVDDNRFLLYMNDGNYVYVNISTFNKLNKYLTILESLPDKNGILYLDYGNNFEIIK